MTAHKKPLIDRMLAIHQKFLAIAKNEIEGTEEEPWYDEQAEIEAALDAHAKAIESGEIEIILPDDMQRPPKEDITPKVPDRAMVPTNAKPFIEQRPRIERILAIHRRLLAISEEAIKEAEEMIEKVEAEQWDDKQAAIDAAAEEAIKEVEEEPWSDDKAEVEAELNAHAEAIASGKIKLYLPDPDYQLMDDETAADTTSDAPNGAMNKEGKVSVKLKADHRASFESINVTIIMENNSDIDCYTTSDSILLDGLIGNKFAIHPLSDIHYAVPYIGISMKYKPTEVILPARSSLSSTLDLAEGYDFAMATPGIFSISFYTFTSIYCDDSDVSFRGLSAETSIDLG